jgi:hypothetical protein
MDSFRPCGGDGWGRIPTVGREGEGRWEFCFETVIEGGSSVGLGWATVTGSC